MASGQSRVIDAHNHVGDLWGPENLYSDNLTRQGELDRDARARIAALTRRGVDQAVVIAAPSYLRPDGLVDTRRMNDLVAAYRDVDPDRFPAAVGVVEPLYGERGLAEVDRCKFELGLVGISFHTRFQGVS